MKNNTSKNKKITKLSDLEQIDGRKNTENNIPTRMDVLFGADGMGKYGTLDREEYIKNLNNYNTAELRNHAIKAGLIPISDVSRLKKQLIVEFDKYALSFKSSNKINGSNKLSDEKQKTGQKIMSILK